MRLSWSDPACECHEHRAWAGCGAELLDEETQQQGQPSAAPSSLQGVPLLLCLSEPAETHRQTADLILKDWALDIK